MHQVEQTEEEFLASYKPGDYPRPSVTSDVIVLTVTPAKKLGVLLIQRAGHPFKNKWAIPGGFLNVNQESSEQAAERELYEETHVSNAKLRQLYTFSKPDRDPRMHVISVAYTALIPYTELKFESGDDASSAKLFSIEYDKRKDEISSLSCEGIALKEADLAFDHAEILKLALRRLQGRIGYELDAFELLEDKSGFTVYDLRRIFEAILGEDLEPANFRRSFLRNYVKTGIVGPTKEKKQSNGAKPAQAYKINLRESE